MIQYLNQTHALVPELVPREHAILKVPVILIGHGIPTQTKQQI